MGRIAWLALGFLLVIPGCPGSLKDPDRFDDPGPGGLCNLDVPSDILAQKCAGSLCHEGDEPAAKLDLVKAGVEARVVGVSADECSGRTLVVAGDADGSYLLEKVASEDPECGDPMPLGAPLKGNEIECIRQWIDGLSGGGAGGTGGSSSGGSTSGGSGGSQSGGGSNTGGSGNASGSSS